MKKLLIIAAIIGCATALTLNAQDSSGKKKTMTDEQKKVYKEMVDKYDTNKDGKLDKEEKAKISEEDKKKMADAGIGGGKKKSQ